MEDSKLLLLEQELKNYKATTDKEFNELKMITNEQEKRIAQLELNNAKTDIQYEQIMKILNKLNEKTIPDLIAQIEELKNKPIKRYDQAITGILGAIAGAVGGAIAGIFFKK